MTGANQTGDNQTGDNQTGADQTDWIALIKEKTAKEQFTKEKPDANPEAVDGAKAGFRAASVMIALMKEAGSQEGGSQKGTGLSLLLTRRADNLKDHPGQISFPGGKHEPQDPSPWHAATRELMEEVGIARSLPVRLGGLPPYHTHSGFRIWPFICQLPAGTATRAQACEVADIFTVPFSFVMDPANAVVCEREWQGRSVRYFTMSYTRPGGQERLIWGVTAGILVELRKHLLGR